MIAAIKKMLIDPVENAVCVLRTCGLITFGTWFVGAAVNVAQGVIAIVHNTPGAHVPIAGIAHSGSIILVALGGALRLKRGLKS